MVWTWMLQRESRKRRRPKQRWSDTIDADLKRLGLNRSDTAYRIRGLAELGVRQKPAERKQRKVSNAEQVVSNHVVAEEAT